MVKESTPSKEELGGEAVKPEEQATPAPRQATAEDVGCSDRDRFELELEFVQCLANPEYLNWLAQSQFFEDEAFLNYLRYLQYWKTPKYNHLITFPHCLYMLDQLQLPEFRKAMKRKDVQIAIAWQQDYFFKFYRRNRLREAAAAKEAAGSGDGATAMDES